MVLDEADIGVGGLREVVLGVYLLRGPRQSITLVSILKRQ